MQGTGWVTQGVDVQVTKVSVLLGRNTVRERKVSQWLLSHGYGEGDYVGVGWGSGGLCARLQAHDSLPK